MEYEWAESFQQNMFVKIKLHYVNTIYTHAKFLFCFVEF